MRSVSLLGHLLLGLCLLRLCFFRWCCLVSLFLSWSFGLRVFRRRHLFSSSGFGSRRSFLSSLLSFSSFRRAFFCSRCSCGLFAAFGFNFCRFRARCVFASCRSLRSALIELVHGLVDLVHHLFADTRNLHQLLRRHRSKLFHGIDSRRFHFLDGLCAHAGQRG